MLRKFAIVVSVMSLTALVAVSANAQGTCVPVRIQSGTLTDANGSPIRTGYDQYGYNYQAHIFNGLLDNYSRPDVPATTGDINLVMKWSDDWLANVSCDNTGKLARGYSAKSGLFSGTSTGWCTNHFEGDYTDLVTGEVYHYTEEIKMVYVGPAPAAGADPWEASRIWGVYAVIEDVINDAGAGFHGVDKSLLANPAGLGFYK